ncbi:hypothetical protein K438DRAFT_1955221 [Mycena galopus ATCC 62051]|nr:hypothetical protein K438DRAFT_1955221 [Mycena galopus ATCC 62051]
MALILLTVLQILVHNAAAVGDKLKLTIDGFESQIATDHIGPFLLTKLLVLKLLAARSASYTPRVVVVSSGTHAYSVVDLSTFAIRQSSTNGPRIARRSPAISSSPSS